MPKRKKVSDYGNNLSSAFKETYLNTWSDNQETREDAKMVSFLIPAVGGSLIQILLCEDEFYNGIFQLKRFEFLENGTSKQPTLVVDDLEVLYEYRPDFTDLHSLISSLSEKYEAFLPEGFPFLEDPLSPSQHLPKLIMD